MTFRLSSPKLSGAADVVVPYYAGFSAQFVDELAQLLDVQDHHAVLDPWNGSGTTTAICSSRASSVSGFDLNPAMIVAAKGRLLSDQTWRSVSPLASEAAAIARRDRTRVAEGDPLLTWFDAPSARRIRRLERAVAHLLVDADASIPAADCVNEISDIAAFLYVALFRAVRGFLHAFRSSNPSWIRRPNKGESTVSVSFRDLQQSWQQFLASLTPSVVSLHQRNSVAISVGDSRQLPLSDDSIDDVITSPPYCTRIDYVVATLPELAVLGASLNRDALRERRAKYIGTPTIDPGFTEDWAELGPTATRFIRKVGVHPSHASGTYYTRFYQQYFQGASASMTELSRVCAPSARAAIVVQDSRYKGELLDLPAVWAELAELNGWSVTQRIDFSVPNPISRINPRAMKYQQHARATESALLLHLNH